MNLEKSVKFLDVYMRSPLTSVMAQSAWADIRAAIEEAQNNSVGVGAVVAPPTEQGTPCPHHRYASCCHYAPYNLLCPKEPCR